MGSFRIITELGNITVRLLPQCAPVTVEHICNLIDAQIFHDSKFYRSDFVIQFGLWNSQKANPFPDLSINETHLHVHRSNVRGTLSVAHHDVPDNGNSEIFINLGSNSHLDSAYGGYCVFAEVEESLENDATIQAIAEAITNEGKHPRISSISMI